MLIVVILKARYGESMPAKPSDSWFVLMAVAAIIVAVVAINCYGARVPGYVTSGGERVKAKTEDEIKAEAEKIKANIESKPDLVAEETYQENEGLEYNLRIVVQSTLDEEENKDIYLLDETGINPIRLTSYTSVESFPSITGDGKKVFFVSDKENQEQSNPFQKPTEVYVIDLDTKEVTRLTFDDRMDYGLSVSDDGTKIVYMTQEMGQEGYENPQMMIMNADGTGQEVIQDEALKNCIPKLSGDGRWVVFNSYRQGSMDIFLMDLENEKTKNLTNTVVSEYFPSINYDGSVIVYEKLLNGIQDESLYELYRIDPDGKNEVAITHYKFGDSFPAVTSDGKQIVFVSKRWDWDEDGHLNEALFIMNIDGSNLRKISKQPAYFDQPDV